MQLAKHTHGTRRSAPFFIDNLSLQTNASTTSLLHLSAVSSHFPTPSPSSCAAWLDERTTAATMHLAVTHLQLFQLIIFQFSGMKSRILAGLGA